jgi:hypothetical protein
MSMTKKELVELLADYPDDAEIGRLTIHTDSRRPDLAEERRTSGTYWPSSTGRSREGAEGRAEPDLPTCIVHRLLSRPAPRGRMALHARPRPGRKERRTR